MERTCEECKKEVLHGVDQTEEAEGRITTQNKKAALQCLGVASPRLLFSCVARMLEGTETDAGKGAELWNAINTIETTQDPQ